MILTDKMYGTQKPT